MTPEIDPRNSKKVLISSDQYLHGEMCSSILSSCGLTVETHYDHQDALWNLLDEDESPCDFAVVDFPFQEAHRKDALELLQQLKDKEIPTIVISSLGREEFAQLDLSVAAQGFLSKPFSDQAFEDAVSKIIPPRKA
jgi:DNA-binding NtrC family response regulator